MRQAFLGMATCALALSLSVGTANAAEKSVQYTATRAIAMDSRDRKVPETECGRNQRAGRGTESHDPATRGDSDDCDCA
jgi:hypothetical protein